MTERPAKRQRLGLSEASATRFIVDRIDTDVCRWLAPVLPDVAGFEMSHTRLAIDVDWSLDLDPHESESYARKVRTAMEAIHAIANCAGFSPASNRGFWQRLGVHFVIPSLERRADALFPLHSTAYSSFQIQCDFSAEPEHLADMLAVCVTVNPGSQATRIRGESAALLGGYLEDTPVPYHVEIATWSHVFDEEAGIPQPRLNWNNLRLTLMHLHRRWTLEQTSNIAQSFVYQEKLTLVLGNAQPHLAVCTTATELTELCGMLMAYPWLELKELHCYVAGDDALLQTVVGPLRTLLRTLVRSNTLRSISWHFDVYHACCVAAIMSALPSLPALRSFGIIFDGASPTHWFPVEDRDPTTLVNAPASFYAWILFVSQIRQQRGHALTMKVRLGDQAVDAVAAARQTTNCLGSLLPESIRDAQQPVYLAHGTTVMVKEHARVYSVADEEQFKVVPFFQAQRVDAIAMYGGQVIVVVPGVGLVRTQQSEVGNWRSSPSSGQTTANNKTAKKPVRHILVCRQSTALGILAMLQGLGSQLSGLSLAGCNLTESAIDTALEFVPTLTQFAFISEDPRVSVIPVVRAYEKGTCKISRLVFSPELTELEPFISEQQPSDALQPLIEAMATPDHPITKTLRYFSCDVVALTHVQATQLVHAVDGSRRVRFLRFGLLENDEALVADMLRKVVSDKPIVSTVSKKSIYAFLSAVKRNVMLQAMPMHPFLHNVAEFSVVRLPRHTSWVINQ